MERESEGVAVMACTHENVQAIRCHLHFGWCGTCLDCGKKVHARYNDFVSTGKKVFEETKYHSQQSMETGG